MADNQVKKLLSLRMQTTINSLKHIVIKYLIHLLSIIVFYIVLVYLANFTFHLLIQKFAQILYAPTSNFYTQLYSLVFIYSLFCYFANNFILDLYHRSNVKNLLLSMFIDLLIVPFAMAIMIYYNNQTVKNELGDVMSIYNIYLIMTLVVIKTTIAYSLISKKSLPSGKVKRKA